MFSGKYPQFEPSRWMRSAHAQTIGSLMWRGQRPPYQGTPHVVPLEDGDQLAIHDDQPADWQPGDRVVILCHGLCGCHASPYMVRTAAKLNREGIRTFRIDMRGFGHSTLLSRSHLHGGCSDDAVDVVRYVHQLCPQSPISLIGFSLGGNVVLRALGRWGARPHDAVDSAVAVCPPIDLVSCAANLRQYGNRIYETYFVQLMCAQLKRRRLQVADLVDNGLNPLPRRLIHFDDQFTAPCWGYRNALEYYTDASAKHWLSQIRIPTVILTSQDDPIVPFAMFRQAELSAWTEVVAPPHGGHLGFLSGRAIDPDRHWMDWRVCEWIARLGRGGVGRPGRDRPASQVANRSRLVLPDGAPVLEDASW